MGRKGFPGMGFPGGMNINKLLKEAQKMQSDMQKSQKEIQDKTFEAVAGGGAVSAKMTGKRELIEINVSEELLDKEEKDMSMAEAFVGADVFVGVSQKDLVSKEMVKSMNKDAIVFALANPQPEILYADAKEAGAKVAATGRSDMPNQINNVVAFPGIFKGALESRAKKITDEMKLAAARGLASMIPDDKIREDYVIVSAFEKNVADVVAKAVADEVRR